MPEGERRTVFIGLHEAKPGLAVRHRYLVRSSSALPPTCLDLQRYPLHFSGFSLQPPERTSRWWSLRRGDCFRSLLRRDVEVFRNRL